MNKDILITIITVCYNAKHCIEETMQSVLEQTYQNIEYIIVDGASTDGTLEIIQEAAKYANIKYISEPDKGIYDAMNKGIELATGDYIQFLNAGDVLIEEDTVKKVAEKIKEKNGDIFYGSIMYKYPNGNTEVRKYGPTCGTRLYYYTGDCINHQAIYASKECLKKNKFDLSYKVCADREWMMRMTKARKKYVCMPINICYYSLDENSTSIKQKEVYNSEARVCIKQHFINGYWIFALLEFCRRRRFLSKALHIFYKLIYIRKV